VSREFFGQKGSVSHQEMRGLIKERRYTVISELDRLLSEEKQEKKCLVI